MKLALLLIAVAADVAAAQPAPPPAPPTAPATADVAAPPPQWIDWDVQGQLIPGDDVETIKGLLSDTMETHRALTESARDDIAAACEKIGYHLVRLDTPPTEGGVRAILVLDAILMVRSVDVIVKEDHFWSPFTEPLFEDEIKRRTRIRPGAYLAHDTVDRTHQLDEEQARIGEYLHDEGYFDAHAAIKLERTDPPGVRARITVELGRTYQTGKIRISGLSPQSPVSADEIRNAFVHEGRLCTDPIVDFCLIDARFTRAQHTTDVAAVTHMFRSRGFHAAKVTTDFDAATSFDRRSGTVAFTVHVDAGRQVDVVFMGNTPDDFPESVLKAQLTFDDAGSADDYEISASAAAIQRYYQSRGHFDAQVTWARDPVRLIDRVVFRIDEGPVRDIRRVDFAVVDGDGKLAIDEGTLNDQVSLRATSLFGGGSYISPTAQTLADDAERIRRLYVQNGYGEARVAVRVGPDPGQLGSPAMLGALLAAETSPHDLYVRFDIQQGPRTLLDTVEVVYVGPHRGTCAAALAQLADGIGVPDLARRAGDGCRAELAELAVPTLPDQLQGAAAKLKDWFWSLGRPRAEAALTIGAAAGDPHHSIATYTVTEHGDVRIGKVIVRGNFRTRTAVILDELHFREGAPLTGDLYASGPRRLRAMNLFSAVNVELLGFEESERDKVDILVRVEERNDVFAQVDVEAGYTQVNGDYARQTTTLPNPLHNGMSFSLAVTFPLHWVPPVLFILPADAKFESVDFDWKTPRWLVRHIPLVGVPVDNDAQFTLRQQDTPRFGQLRTLGVSDALSRVWQSPHVGDAPAHSTAATLRFDFRDRQRDQDAIRPIGPGSDTTQAPVRTRTGSLGFTLVYDRRHDTRGNLNPLIPDGGFKLEAGALFATPYLGGQDTFFKINATGQYIDTINDRLQIHVDAKLDEGFPLGGAVLLPEVERFFAGGDTTVRGFAEDRLATEIVETGVPPFGGVRQIRVLPAGGNIRVLGSIDAQVRVWRLLGIPVAAAIFVDAGIVTNTWRALSPANVRPAIGVSLFRWLAPFGAISIDYAVPMFPHPGDNPNGFFAISVALR